MFCCDAHRQAHFRRTHPLGWRYLGADQASPLRLLDDQGVELLRLRVVDAWVASQRPSR